MAKNKSCATANSSSTRSTSQLTLQPQIRVPHVPRLGHGLPTDHRRPSRQNPRETHPAATLAPMLQPYRDQFNAQFLPAWYDNLLYRLNHITRTSIEFRVAETPCFLSRDLMNELAETGAEL